MTPHPKPDLRAAPGSGPNPRRRRDARRGCERTRTWLTRCGGDEGSISLYAMSAVFAFFLLIGLVVDGSAKLRAQQRAHAVAEEAARAGGQAVAVAGAIEGQAPVVDAYGAAAAASSFLQAAGVEGRVTVADGGTRLTVVTSVPFTPEFLGQVGVRGSTVTAIAHVDMVRGDEIGQS